MRSIIFFSSFIASTAFVFGQSNTVDTTLVYFSTQYEFKLIGADEKNFDYGKSNSFFLVKNVRTGRVIVSDSLQSMLPEIRFEDYNSDKINDVLVYSVHGARANTTYYLYLADPVNQYFKKVEGFEELPNTSIDKNGIIQSVALYGKIGYSFYRITKDYKVRQLGTTVEVEPDESYRKIRSEYRKVLKSLRREK